MTLTKDTFQIEADFSPFCFTKAMHSLLTWIPWTLVFDSVDRKTWTRKVISGLQLDKDTNRNGMAISRGLRPKLSFSLCIQPSISGWLEGCCICVALCTGGWSTCCQKDSADVTLLQPIRNDDDPPRPPSTFVGYRSATSLVESFQPSCPLWQTD